MRQRSIRFIARKRSVVTGAVFAAFAIIAAFAIQFAAGGAHQNVAKPALPARISETPNATDPVASARHAFLETHCFECHDADNKKGDLDLTALPFDLSAPQTFTNWVTIYDRVDKGEMPPKKKTPPPAAEKQAFTRALASSLVAAETARAVIDGRSTQRRLNRYEYESTLRDLLSLPYLDVKDFLPEDSELHGFNKVGEALDVSHVHMGRYLSAADFALRQAMAPQTARPPTTTVRYYTWDQPGWIKRPGGAPRQTYPLVGLELQRDLVTGDKAPKMHSSADPVRREKESTAMVISAYEPTEPQFNKFRAPVSGKYRLKLSGYTIWMGADYKHVTVGRRPEPVTVYAETPPRRLRKLGGFDFQTQPTVCDLEVYLIAGETIRPDAARLYRDRPGGKNPNMEPDGMPGVAFQWLEVEGPIIDQWPQAGHRLMFGTLPTTDRPSTASVRKFSLPGGVDVTSKEPEKDAERLLRGFMARAYRRPVQETDVARFMTVIKGALKVGDSFTESMIAGYTAVLSSPGFLYLSEKPGRLDDLALAERLSYFLWNSDPDAELLRLAQKGELHNPDVLNRQTDRLLNDPKSARFVEAFLDYWLDLRLISGTAPDGELYPDYQLDDLLVESMIGETQGFFAELLRKDLSVTNLVESDFAVLNERLATHYGIPGVKGVGLRPVPLPKGSVRGGLMTQASILKVTANGTTTSPVKRGVWIMSRLLGKPPPPPPTSVPAVEPDIRGATTIREQLAKHRTQESCNACHRNIDPAGFALESFDVMGAWRTQYRAIGAGTPVKGNGHNGLPFHFSQGLAVDPSGVLPDGEKFQSVRELKQCLLKDPEQIARNLAEQLTVYATGAGIRFSDRPAIAKILADSRTKGYGVRTLVHAIVQNDLFLNK